MSVRVLIKTCPGVRVCAVGHEERAESIDKLSEVELQQHSVPLL